MADTGGARPSVLGTRPWSDAATCNAPAEAAPPLPATGGGSRAVAIGAALLGALVSLRVRARDRSVSSSREA